MVSDSVTRGPMILSMILTIANVSLTNSIDDTFKSGSCLSGFPRYNAISGGMLLSRPTGCGVLVLEILKHQAEYIFWLSKISYHKLYGYYSLILIFVLIS